MATIEKTVEVIFAGKDDVSRVMRTIRGGLGDLDRMAQAVAGPLAQVADAVLSANAALAGLAAGGLALAIKSAGEFQQGFAEISTLLDASGDDLEAFRRAVEQYAATSTQSWDEVQQAIYNAISAGVDYKNAIDLVAQAEKLAVAGRADLNDTTVLLVSTMNAYGASADQAAKYSDALFQTVRLGQTTIPQLAQSLAQVTGTAAGARVPFEEVAAAIATLTAAGLPTSQAITAIKQALSNILKPSSEAAKTAEDLGIQFDAAALKSKGFSGVLADVARATGGNVDVMGRLFGSVEALNGVIILAGTGADTFRANLEAMGRSAGSTQAAFNKMADDIDLAMQRVKNAARYALNQAGQPLLDQFGDVSEAISQVFLALGQSIDTGAMDDLVGAVERAGDALAGFLGDVAQALPGALDQVDFTPITDALTRAGDALRDFFGEVDLTTVDGLAQAIQGAVDTIGSLIDATTGIAQAFSPVLDALAEAVRRFNDLSPQQKVDIGRQWLGTAKLIQQAGTEIGGAIAVIANTGADMKSAFDVIVGSIEGAWETLKTGVLNAEWLVVGSLQQIVSAVNTLTFGKIPWVDDLDQSLTTLRQVIEEQLIGTATEANQAWATAWGGLTGLFDDGTRKVTQAMGTLKDAAAQVTDTAGQAKQGVDDLFQTFLDQVNALSPATGGVSQDLADIGREIVALDQAADPVAQSLDRVGQSLDTVSQKAKQAQQDSEDFRLKMAAIKADFAKTALKLSVDLRVAQVQAQADQIKSIMSGLSTSFQSVTSAISQMTGQWAGLVGGNLSQWTASNQLWTLIQQQAQQQQQYTQAQIQLAQAQIQLLQARTQALQSGQALIQIDGTGLSPSLQLVMWEILEQVQLRVNQSAADLLMGI